MRREPRLTATTALVVLLSACADTPNTTSVTGPPSLQVVSGETQCTGLIVGGEYERILVPPGANCSMHGTVVIRDVVALENSSLEILGGDVGSDIEALGANGVLISGLSVGGRIRIDGGGGGAGRTGAWIRAVTVETSDIVVRQQNTGTIFLDANHVLKGGIRVSGNVTGDFLQINSNDAARSIEVVDNRGDGAKFVQFNTALVSIVCKRNSPPFIGSPNFAPSVQGQCA